MPASSIAPISASPYPASANTCSSAVASRWRAGYFDEEARLFAGTFDRHVDEVVRAVRAGGPPPIHARAGRRALELAQLAIESHELGRRVGVPTRA